MYGMIWLHPLKHKVDFVDWFVKMDPIFINQYGRHIGPLHTDNGGKYVNQQLKQYANKHGILLELTLPHPQQKNGVAKRVNHTLTEWIRAMIKDADCRVAYGAEA